MKVAFYLLLILITGACQSSYVPAVDGRVSVIDLTLFPAHYRDKTVISHGYLRWDEQRASLLFDKNHITRRSVRFAIDMEISEAMTEQAQSCAGQEVLVKGVVEQRESGWVLSSVEDFVC